MFSVCTDWADTFGKTKWERQKSWILNGSLENSFAVSLYFAVDLWNVILWHMVTVNDSL